MSSSSAVLLLVVAFIFVLSIAAAVWFIWYWRNNMDTGDGGGDGGGAAAGSTTTTTVAQAVRAGTAALVGGPTALVAAAGPAVVVPAPSGGLIAHLENFLTVNIRPGMGNAVQHALNKTYRAPFPLAATGCVVRFEIKFGPPFEWGCRGKVGGIHIGPGAASGGRYSSNGASHRLMWDRGGGAYAYVYIPSGSAGRQPAPLRNPGTNGQLVFQRDFAGVFRVGQWYVVELGVRLNTVGANDGVLMLSINGKRRILNGVVWRLSNLPIQSFSFGVFHGGPCKATQNSIMNMRNVSVYRW